ncbi:hypothetical protein Q5530_26640 [Saccharothrix sp. BKS2]|uniref:hypothetical protein n=1 Tax=Saccharothrix sp. BKS2 TaxID=3064400 RepID=UPI0039ECD130
MSKRILVARVVAVGAMVVSSAVGAGVSSAGATVPSAQAIDCTQYGTNKNPGTLTTDGAAPYRRGPAGECASVGSHSGLAYIWCQKVNAYGHLWYYVRDSSSNTVGWVWSGNVRSTSGSNNARC